MNDILARFRRVRDSRSRDGLRLRRKTMYSRQPQGQNGQTHGLELGMNMQCSTDTVNPGYARSLASSIAPLLHCWTELI